MKLKKSRDRNSSPRKPLPSIPPVIEAKIQMVRELSLIAVREAFDDYIIHQMENEILKLNKLKHVSELEKQNVIDTFEDLIENIHKLYDRTTQAKNKQDFKSILLDIKNFKMARKQAFKASYMLDLNRDCSIEYKETRKCNENYCDKSLFGCKNFSKEKKMTKLKSKFYDYY